MLHFWEVNWSCKVGLLATYELWCIVEYMTLDEMIKEIMLFGQL